jgi:hypothetical protein
MMLVEITINGTLHRVSDEQQELTHPWDRLVDGLSAPQLSLDQAYGGYCRVNYGKIDFNPELFDEDWPPPISCTITIKHTETTEEAAVTLIDAVAHIGAGGITEDTISYNLFRATYDTELLDEVTDDNGDDVPEPRAFGAVSFVKPVLLDKVTEKYSAGGITTGFQAYDDGVAVASTLNTGTNTFTLTAPPVGDVSISGSNSESTLAAVFTWASTRLGVTLDATGDRPTSPTVGFWADSQSVLVDFLSEISAFYTHMFWIKSGTAYLQDMFIANGTTAIDEFEFFSGTTYEYNPPVKSITAEYPVRVAGQWQDGSGGSAGRYVKETQEEVKVVSTYDHAKDEMSVTPYIYDRAAITTALNNILTITHRPAFSLAIPAEGNIAEPGAQITYTHTLHLDVDVTGYFRNITYDYFENEFIVSGDCVIA